MISQHTGLPIEAPSGIASVPCGATGRDTCTGASSASEYVALQGRPVKGSFAVATRWRKRPP